MGMDLSCSCFVMHLFVVGSSCNLWMLLIFRNFCGGELMMLPLFSIFVRCVSPLLTISLLLICLFSFSVSSGLQ